MASSAGRQWVQLWGPEFYLPSAAMPMLWLNGTNDFAYPLDSMQKSYTTNMGASHLCIRVEMPHSHADGWAPAEIAAFADHAFGIGSAVAIPEVVDSGCERDGTLYCTVVTDPRAPLASVDLCFTRATGYWQDRKYNRSPVEKVTWKRLPGQKPTYNIRAQTPGHCVAFLTLTDTRGMLASTPHVDLTASTDARL